MFRVEEYAAELVVEAIAFEIRRMKELERDYLQRGNPSAWALKQVQLGELRSFRSILKRHLRNKGPMPRAWQAFLEKDVETRAGKMPTSAAAAPSKGA